MILWGPASFKTDQLPAQARKPLVHITDVRKHPKVKRSDHDGPQGPQLYHHPTHSHSGCFCLQHHGAFHQALHVRLVPIHSCCLTDVTCEEQLTSSQFISSWKMDTFAAIQAQFFIRTRMCCSKCCTQHLGMMPLTRGTGASRKMSYYTRHCLCPFLKFKRKMQALTDLTAWYCCFCNIQDPARFLEETWQNCSSESNVSLLDSSKWCNDSVWDDAAPALGLKSSFMVNKDTLKQGCT